MVTDGWFRAQRQRLAVSDIDEIGWRQSAGRVTGRVARVMVLTETALVLVVAALATAIGGPSILGFTVAGVHLAVAGLVTWLTTFRYPGSLQLWVKRNDGQQVLLFSSPDQIEFHKVRRALERAVEYHEELAF